MRHAASARDRRAVIVSLTPRGVELCEEIRRTWAELEAATTSGMSDRDRDALLHALQHAAKRLPTPSD
ncbi:MAG: hypothetical protein ACRDJW_05355 [Thermomicrobiales bacterium]